MAFTKIKETIEAFRYPPAEMTVQEKIDKYHQELDARIHGKQPAKAISFAVLIAAVIPVSIFIGRMISELLDVSDMKSTAVVAVILGYFGNELFERIPFHKLNPYFGSKIQDTINAFKTPS